MLMISVFDLEKLRPLLKDFYLLTKIRIMVYDENFRDLCSYPEQRAPICRLIRTNLRADEACRQCDTAACRRASRQKEPYIYTCHAGLTEAIATIRVDTVIVGYLSFGHLFAYDDHETGIAKIWEQVGRYKLPEEAVCDACKEQPLLSRDYILSAAHILHAVASLLVMERMAVLKKESIEVRLDRYLAENFTKPIDAKLLCNHFHIGKTKLYEILRQSYGCGLGEHLRRLRMEKAKALLEEQPQMTISEVAMACGYENYNYFIATFSKMVGRSPCQYRKNRSILA